MKDSGCRQVPSQQAGGVWKQSRTRVEDCQAEESNCPHTMEDLKEGGQLKLISITFKSLCKILSNKDYGDEQS